MNFCCKLELTLGVQPPELINLKFLLFEKKLNISCLTFGVTLLHVIFPTKEHNIFFLLKSLFGILSNVFRLSS